MVVRLWVEEAPHDPLVMEVGGMGAALGAHRVSWTFLISVKTGIYLGP